MKYQVRCRLLLPSFASFALASAVSGEIVCAMLMDMATKKPSTVPIKLGVKSKDTHGLAMRQPDPLAWDRAGPESGPQVNISFGLSD